MGNVEISWRNIYLCIVVFNLILLSCNNRVEDNEYYYKVVNDKQITTSYLKIRVEKSPNNIKLKKYFFNTNIQITDSIVENYNLNGKIINRVFKKDSLIQKTPFLILEKDTCTVFKTNFYPLELYNCFLEQYNMTLNKTTYKNSIKYTSQENETDGVKTIKIVDENFIPIKEEYISGYRDYFKVERINSFPNQLGDDSN
jgi:hypothetical protein